MKTCALLYLETGYHKPQVHKTARETAWMRGKTAKKCWTTQRKIIRRAAGNTHMQKKHGKSQKKRVHDQVLCMNTL